MGEGRSPAGVLVAGEEVMKNLPVGIQTFEKLISENYLYVDKTEYIYRLIKQSECYFLSRPRRFGKSLLVSTLKALFEGKRELFKGLWIYGADYDWHSCPVITFNLSSLPNTTERALATNLILAIEKNAREHHLQIPDKFLQSPSAALDYLVTEVARTHEGKVVILVDEYDHPILGNLPDGVELKAIQKLLQNFYATIKSLDEYLRFVFITGVSKFSQTSIFSGLNNLKDVSDRKEYASLLGYTQQELENCFGDRISRFADEKQTNMVHILGELKRWYNGYRFTENPQLVYNPFSILNSLDDFVFKNYWFQSGTPTFLVKLLLSNNYAVQEIDAVEIDKNDLGVMDVELPRLVPLLFQTGYLTIKKYDNETELMTLGYPNYEVEDSFTKFFMQYLTHRSTAQVRRDVEPLLNNLQDGDVDKFCSELTTVFANIPHTIHLKYEKYYQSLFYLLLHLMGAEINAEVATNTGRIDAVIKTTERIFVIEFKLGVFADQALDQIIEKKYYEKYLQDSRKIVLLGIAFDTHKKNIGECKSFVLS